MRHLILATVWLFLVLGSCSEPTGSEDLRADFRTDRSEYSIGEEVVLTLRNTGQYEIRIRQSCRAELERQVNGKWESRGFGNEAVCLLRSIGTVHVAPSEVQADTLTVSDARYEPGGTYRFVTVIRERYEVDRTKAVHSNSFTVTE